MAESEEVYVLTPIQRKHRFIDGYVRTVIKLHNIEIPNDLKTILTMYIASTYDGKKEGLPAVNVAIFGAHSVGKTWISKRFAHRTRPLETKPIRFDQNWTVETYLDNKEVHLNILDTHAISPKESRESAGKLLMDHWISENDGFILMYAVNNPDSFHIVKEQYKQLLKMKGKERIDLILVGHKNDIYTEHRRITREMGERLANEWGVSFIEASAKTGYNVREVFKSIVKEIRMAKEPIQYSGDIGGGQGCHFCAIL